MKEFIAVIVAWLGGTVMVVSFWVWIATLLLWKIFTIVGAASFIYPAFWIMIIGAVIWLCGVIVMFGKMR
ncbi:hypothetical protein I6H59_06115 [Lactococcus garvieae]|nr:hypothetical protein I6H59_06115 [Lactococcus garvieae]